MILLITNKEDVHPTPVIERLTERGIPFFRLNTEIQKKSEVSLNFIQKTEGVIYREAGLEEGERDTVSQWKVWAHHLRQQLCGAGVRQEAGGGRPGGELRGELPP